MIKAMFDRYDDLHPVAPPPVGAYMTDGQRLIEILESDGKGALGEDVKTMLLVPIETSDMCNGADPPGRVCWRRVIPAED